MKLSEIFEDLSKEGWKNVPDKKYSGTQGITTKWQKDINGAKNTVFKKESVSYLSYPFETNQHLSMLFNEIAARKIITMINTAWRAYGGKTDIYKIPIMHKYDIDLINDNQRLKVDFESSSFNNTSDDADGLVELYRRRIAVFNILLGNLDTHNGNFVVNKKKTSIYSIDLGLAFVTKFSRVNIEALLQQIKNKKEGLSGINKKPEQHKKLIANFLNFVEMFIEHNGKNLYAVLDDTAKEISIHIAKKILKKNPDEKLEMTIVNVLGMFEKTVNAKKVVLKNNIGVVKKFVKEAKAML